MRCGDGDRMSDFKVFWQVTVDTQTEDRRIGEDRKLKRLFLTVTGPGPALDPVGLATEA